MNRPSRTQSVRTVPFDAAEYLADEETQLAYLNTALAEGDAQAMVTALGTVARTRGMSRVAKRAAWAREPYKALSDSGNPALTPTSESRLHWDTHSRCERPRQSRRDNGKRT